MEISASFLTRVTMVNLQSMYSYRIDRTNKLISLNREWLDFAKENRAPELTREYVLGKPIEQFIAGWENRHLYDLLYARVRRTQQDITFPFNCDSPTFRRSFQMRIVPLENGALEFIVKVVKIERLRPLRHILDPRIEHAKEIVVICSWCKKIRIDGDLWVEIDAAPAKNNLFGTNPPSLTHDVCPDCLANIQSQLENR